MGVDWLQHEHLNFVFVNTITQYILVTLGPNLYHGCISGVSWFSLTMDHLDQSFKVMTSIACKHDNLTNINHIWTKLIHWMYLRSVLVKFAEGWPWPILRGYGARFQHENCTFLLVNTITQQILVALAPNLYHECISGVSWLSLKMDELDLYVEVMGVDFNMKNLYHGCISSES